MTEITFEKAKWMTDSEGIWLMLQAKESGAVKNFCQSKKDKQYTARLKEDYGKRSLDANAYMWTLCDKIAKKLETTKENVYLEVIRRVGVYEYLLLPDKAIESFTRHWEAGGLGNIVKTIDGSKVKDCTRVIVYYGSSTYDKKEMAALINEVVFEAKELGIETYTPEQLAALTDRWKNEEKNEST